MGGSEAPDPGNGVRRSGKANLELLWVDESIYCRLPSPQAIIGASLNGERPMRGPTSDTAGTILFRPWGAFWVLP